MDRNELITKLREEFSNTKKLLNEKSTWADLYVATQHARFLAENFQRPSGLAPITDAEMSYIYGVVDSLEPDRAASIG